LIPPIQRLERQTASLSSLKRYDAALALDPNLALGWGDYSALRREAEAQEAARRAKEPGGQTTYPLAL
jgi:hypothetical protein